MSAEAYLECIEDYLFSGKWAVAIHHSATALKAMITKR